MVLLDWGVLVVLELRLVVWCVLVRLGVSESEVGLVSFVYLAGNGIIVRGMRWDGADWLYVVSPWLAFQLI